MFIESNVGSLTEMFVVLVTTSNDLKREGVLKEINITYGDVIWESKPNVIRKRSREERTEIGYAINIRGDINDNYADRKILQYEINKRLSNIFNEEYYCENDNVIRIYYSPDYVDILFLNHNLDKK